MSARRIHPFPARMAPDIALDAIPQRVDEVLTVLDPMCGSGTFIIEAALMALQIAPGTLRSRFGFQNWKTYQPEAFESALEKCF